MSSERRDPHPPSPKGCAQDADNGEPAAVRSWCRRSRGLGPPLAVGAGAGPTRARDRPSASTLLQNSGLSGGEPPEKERRRLKESFENYRRWARVGAGRGKGRGGRPQGHCAHPRLGPPAGSGRSASCSTARGKGRWTGRTPRAATTRTPRAPSGSGRRRRAGPGQQLIPRPRRGRRLVRPPLWPPVSAPAHALCQSPACSTFM